jgi:uncharacterized coiled-coil DUF342 family protein
MNHEELLKEIQSLETNLSYYKRDLKKFFKKLKNEYGIKPDGVDDRIEAIGEEIEELQENRRKLRKRINKKLERIKDAKRSRRI